MPHSEPKATAIAVVAAAPIDPAVSDAMLLADYGSPPTHWLLSPLYAMRVLKRRHELKKALLTRSSESERATAEFQDALAALAEGILAVAAKHPGYTEAVGALRRAEDLLRVRDRVLTVENEAEMARLASADARLAKLESDLATSEAEERTLAVELESARQALEREEAKLKKAESDLRAAQRETPGVRE